MPFIQKIFSTVLMYFIFSQTLCAQACFPNEVVTATFAKGGSSPYIDKVLWLTWGAETNNVQLYPYGRSDQQLKVGNKSRASIHMGGNSYLCIEVEIISITGGNTNSYIPGYYSGDSMDKLYNIGGTGSNNKMVCGIINKTNGQTSTLKFRAKATINGAPIRLSGLVVADAESLAARSRGAQTEYIRATAFGKWNIVDIRKNLGKGSYKITKTTVEQNQQQIEFQEGNDQNTGAVAFLEFNEYAYNKQNDFAVEFTAELKGGGLTALALGLLTPNADLGDAPASYGAPLHLIQNLKITTDGINVDNNATDINTNSYTPGALQLTDGKYLGSAPPDGDYEPKHSKDALGDDKSGTGSINEEDGWPAAFKRISYKENYAPGNLINVNIPFKNGVVGDRISGWIDFDLNGLFDEVERKTKQITATDITNGYVVLSWTIPSTRVVGSTYIRLRYFDSKEDFVSPTQSANFGEVEDHKLIILAPKTTNPMLLNTLK